jgi:hypothetical protein
LLVDLGEDHELSQSPPKSTRYESEIDDLYEPLRSLSSDGDSSEGRVRPWPSLLGPLLASWPLLLIGVLAGPFIYAAIQSQAPAMYVAEALVAPNRSITQVNFVPQIKTVDDSSSPSTSGLLTPERRQALVDLVRSSNVEDQVITDLASKASPNELEQGSLIQHITGSIRPRSEILSIQASSASQADAVLIVNAWAKAYVDSVNRIYSGGSADDSLTALRDQAHEEVAAAEAALANSIQSSQMESLTRQIQSKQALLTLLESPYQNPSSTSGAQGSATTPQSAAAVSNDYRLADRRTLDDLAQTLRRIDVTRENVRTLLNQSQTNGVGSSSDSAALAILKTQLVAISDGLPSQIQFQLPSGDSAGSLADLTALATSLDQARTDVAGELDNRRAAYEQATSRQISELDDQLRDLRAQNEAAVAERKRLTAARDLADATYTALAQKAEELRVAASTAGHEVELASDASFATQVPRQNALALIAAAVLGLLVGSVVAVARWYASGLGRGAKIPTGERVSATSQGDAHP